MKIYLIFLLIGVLYPFVVKSFLIKDSANDNTVIDNDSSDELSAEESSNGEQTGIYARVLHNLYKPYLKNTVSKGVVPQETNRRKRDGNARKPMLMKRQVNARKPILLLTPEETPPESESESKREISLNKNRESISRSIPVPDDNEDLSEENRVDGGIVARSDRARRPILLDA